MSVIVTTYTYQVHPVVISTSATYLSGISNAVNNPNLPYSGPISGGLKVGMAVCFRGSVSMDAKRFQIDFTTGGGASEDIAFHFNPRFDDEVVLNSFQNGSWGQEDYASVDVFRKGGGFEMAIVVKAEGYQVLIDGKENCMFQHRIPLERVQGLNISGDVSIKLFGFVQNWSASGGSAEPSQEVGPSGDTDAGYVQSTLRTDRTNFVQNPNIPYLGKLSGGLKTGMAIYFKGTIPDEATRFQVYFKSGPSESDDVAFLYDLHFGQKVVFNSFRNGSWEKEESGSINYYTKGNPFEFVIVILEQGYQMYVNGEDCGIFLHRIPLLNVMVLKFLGDCYITRFGFIQDWTAWSVEHGQKSADWALVPISSGNAYEVFDPSIPFTGKISTGLSAGMIMYVQGMIPSVAISFEVSLKCGMLDSDDIAFLYKVYFGQSIVLNSYQNGAWGTEQSVSDNPFNKGQPFEMAIIVLSSGYVIYVNGKEICQFLHRLPLARVKAFRIDGDVDDLSIIGFIGPETIPTNSFMEKPRPASKIEGRDWRLSNICGDITRVLSNPNIPYVADLPRKLWPGIAMYFQGMIPLTSNRFQIDLKCGKSESDAIAFHLNPRFGSHVVFNSFQSGAWGSEEHASNPLRLGNPFEIIIVIESDVYQVYVNGERIGQFAHRISLQSVNAIKISGEVYINNFGYIENWNQTIRFLEEGQQIQRSWRTHDWGKENVFWSLSTLNAGIYNALSTPSIPYTGKLAVDLRAGTALFIQGMIPIDANMFRVDLRAGEGETDDVIFHYNPRFGQYVALNTFRNGGWENEESAEDKLFTKGAPFELIILAETHGFKVYVNGEDNCMFTYRIPLENVRALSISGDVSIMLFGYIKNWDNAYVVEKRFSGQHAIPLLTPVRSKCFHNPPVPFLTTFLGGLSKDRPIYIQGKVPPRAKRFDVILSHGDNTFPLHIEPRFNDGEVVLCSFQGSWGPTVRAYGKMNPFQLGQNFEIEIHCDDSQYTLTVNRTHTCHFAHRVLPYQAITKLWIKYDVILHDVYF